MYLYIYIYTHAHTVVCISNTNTHTHQQERQEVEKQAGADRAESLSVAPENTPVKNPCGYFQWHCCEHSPSVLPCGVVVYCSALQCVAMKNPCGYFHPLPRQLLCGSHSLSVLQCVAVCCSVLQCVAVCCSVLQSVAVCCSVLQCVAVRLEIAADSDIGSKICVAYRTHLVIVCCSCCGVLQLLRCVAVW